MKKQPLIKEIEGIFKNNHREIEKRLAMIKESWREQQSLEAFRLSIELASLFGEQLTLKPLIKNYSKKEI